MPCYSKGLVKNFKIKDENSGQTKPQWAVQLLFTTELIPSDLMSELVSSAILHVCFKYGYLSVFSINVFLQEEEIKLKPVIAFDCGKISDEIFIMLVDSLCLNFFDFGAVLDINSLMKISLNN